MCIAQLFYSDICNNNNNNKNSKNRKVSKPVQQASSQAKAWAGGDEEGRFFFK